MAQDQMAGSTAEQRMASWRRALFVGAVLLVAQVPLELRYDGWATALALRLVWVTLLLLAMPMVRPDRRRLAVWAAHLSGLASGILGSAIIAVTGGSTGPRFGFLLAFPLVVLVLAPDVPWAAGAMGLGTMVGGILIILHDQRDGWFVVEWAVLSFTATLLAIQGTRASRRLFASELGARQSRAEALLQLNEAQHAAAVGRLAAAVAHRVSSPLAAVKSNLQYLLRGPGAGALVPDAVEALEESVVCVDQAARVLTQLRWIPEIHPEAASLCDVGEMLEEVVGLVIAHSAGVEVEVEPGLPPVLVGRQGLVLALGGAMVEVDLASGSNGGRSPIGLRLRAIRSGSCVQVRIGGKVGEALREAWTPTNLAVISAMVERSGASLDVEVTQDGRRELLIELPTAGCAAPGA
jgi:signal transduction histidine kinase